jgi:serine O-acetyltransferase
MCWRVVADTAVPSIAVPEAWYDDLTRLGGPTTPAGIIRQLLRDPLFRVLFTLRAWQAATSSGTGGVWCRKLAGRAHLWTTRRAAMDFPVSLTVAPGLAITHGWGLVVAPGTVIGRNVTLFHGVTLGTRDRIDDTGERTNLGVPTIDDEVWIGPGACVLGPVHVGRGARIGAGAIVITDVPAGAVVVAGPARVARLGSPPDVVNPAPDRRAQ